MWAEERIIRDIIEWLVKKGFGEAAHAARGHFWLQGEKICKTCNAIFYQTEAEYAHDGRCYACRTYQDD